MTIVAITRNKAIRKAIHEAFDHLPLSKLIRGKVVAVKPNETWASRKDTTGVTQPDTLRSVLEVVKEFDPAELIVIGGRASWGWAKPRPRK